MGKIHLISVNMGYGHQRTAYPLKSLVSEGKIIQANDYPGIPKKDREIWETARRFYEAVSKFKRVPLIGELVFSIFNQSQKIFSFYPKRDMSKPNLQLKQIFSLIKRGWGRGLIETLRRGSGQEPFPLVSTFFVPAFMAEYFNYPGEIFCVVCDADISRTWAPFYPKTSRIKYFAPNDRVVERLKLYGIKENNIFLTGYPLSQDLIGDEKLEILKNNLKYRLFNLDSKKRFFQYYEPLTKKYLGGLPKKSNHPLTLMFAVGGAGAQKEIGIKIARSLKEEIKTGQIKIILSAGIKEKVKKYFEKKLEKLQRSEKGLLYNLGKSVEIIFEKDIENYFQKFNQALRKTDILWTKPSELSFYSVLGIPIIIAPPIGSQEEFNKRWLLKSGFGLLQENPNYVEQWLFDWLEKGYLAEAAMQGFIEGEKLGTFKIQKICCG